MKIKDKRKICITLTKEEAFELRDALQQFLSQTPEQGIYPKDQYPNLIKMVNELHWA